jgi:hypothetical protein
MLYLYAKNKVPGMQVAQDTTRSFVGCHVDEATRAQLLHLAHAEDRSMASILRRPISRELEHIERAHPSEMEAHSER